eukprot:9021135-Prorocentrum_lima.AAC.1
MLLPAGRQVCWRHRATRIRQKVQASQGKASMKSLPVTAITGKIPGKSSGAWRRKVTSGHFHWHAVCARR